MLQMSRSFHCILLALTLVATRAAAQSVTGDSVTFADHVAPILYESCVVCHRPEGVGPFSLIEYEQVKRRSRQIGEVVSSRYMPPWKPDPAHTPALVGERRLSEGEIEILNRWNEYGAPSGDLANAPDPPVFESGWQLGEPDLVLSFPEAYELASEGADVYRNFVIPAPVSQTRYVKAMEFRPSSQGVIHHAVVQVDASDTSREQDALDPGPGFNGMGVGTSAPPEGQFVGWTPGQVPHQSYPGTAWTLEPGSDIVVQLHLLPSGKVEEVSPRIGLYFSEEPPERSSFVLQMRKFEIDIEPGESDYAFEERFDVPVDVEIIGVYPHAHYVGKDLSAYAQLPDGSKQWLFRIPDWDFNWQSDYRYETPIRIPAGSTLGMVYVYDNSAENPRNPNDPPQRVTGGWKSTDEMGELSIQAMPVRESDYAALEGAQREYNIRLAGGQSRYAYNLGNYFELQGLLEKAGQYYYDATRVEPSLASAHFKLGHVLERLGNSIGAENAYRQALALRPELIPANIGMARIHFLNRNDFLAVDQLEQVLSWEPNHYEARLYLARVHEANRRYDQALELLETGLEYHASNPYYRLELGKLLQQTAQGQAALEAFEYAANHSLETRTPRSPKETASLKSEAYYSMAKIRLESQEADLAEALLKQAIEIMPHHSRALLESARLAFEGGDKSRCELRLDQLASLPEAIRPPRERVESVLSSTEWRSLVERAFRAE